MDLTPRPFCWDDLPALHALISTRWRADGPKVALHIGDLYWGTRPQPGREPTKDIALWEDRDGRLQAITWWDHQDSGTVVTHPDAGLDVEETLVAWLEDEARRRGSKAFTTACFLDDEARLAMLTKRGYEKAGEGDPHLHLSLEDRVAEPEPPGGYRVRSIEGPHEIEARAAVHRAAWSDNQPSAVTLEVYEALVRMPQYRQELDLVAVDSNGEFVSCTNVWYDAEIRVGEFEPVGCHPKHRRKGVTRALMLEGLRRLRALGAEQAIVYTSSTNPGAQALYESCGFRVIGLYWYYTKRLD